VLLAGDAVTVLSAMSPPFSSCHCFILSITLVVKLNIATEWFCTLGGRLGVIDFGAVVVVVVDPGSDDDDNDDKDDIDDNDEDDEEDAGAETLK